MRSRSRSRAAVDSVVGMLAALRAGPAEADCLPATRQSPCFDAAELWIPAAPTPFVGIPLAGYAAAGGRSCSGARGLVLGASLASGVPGGDRRGAQWIPRALAQVGSRPRQRVAAAGARLGTRLVSTLAVGLHVLSEERLSIAAEA